MTAGTGWIGFVFVAALLGSFPAGWLIGRLFGGEDLRVTGSGSTGTTNVVRRVGTWAGALTLILDGAKGAAAVGLAAAFSPVSWAAPASAAAVVAAHCWNPWLRFRGGRGVAPAAGAFAVLSLSSTIVALGVFGVALVISRRVSVGSLTAATALPVATLLREEPRATILASVAVAAVIWIRHRTNLSRLRAGTEPKLGE